MQLKYIIISLAAGMLGGFGYGYFFPAEKEIEIIRERDTLATGVAVSGNMLHAPAPNLIDASAASTGSVVFIRTTSETYIQSYSWFDMFFGDGGGYEQKQVSTGSGVIYSKDGYIITNNHVIDRARRIEIIHGKRTYEAGLIGTDPSTDLAVLKVESNNLPAIAWGRSADVQVGEWVLAVGNPFNLNSTVTAGIVSAKGRSINILKGNFPIESFIQTDAAINPGNSGGALVNSAGALIGINTAILSRTGSYTGYGFAVPSDIVKKSVDDIIRYGEVQKAFFGAEAGELDYETATKLNAGEPGGVVLTYVQKGWAAEKQGLEKGDIILQLNGKKTDSKAAFDEILSYYSPGEKIKVLYERDGKIKETELTLSNREGTTGVIKKEVFSSGTLGAELETVPKIERDKLNIESGVRILNIRNGLIRRMQLPEGFIVVSVNKKSVTKPAELIEVLETARGKVIVEGVIPGGAKRYYSFWF